MKEIKTFKSEIDDGIGELVKSTASVAHCSETTVHKSTAEAAKNAILQVQGKEERQRAGRLWAHFKHIEMRDQVRSMRANEGTLREETMDEAE